MEKKEAMKILKDFYDKSALFSIRTALDTVIPELTENEDERIRKDIISYLRNEKIVKRYISDIEIDKWIAWLEKQKPNTRKREIDDAYLQGICDAKHAIEKQSENNQEPVQKPFDYEHATIHQKDFAPKDEPKFKVGDWVILNGTVAQILDKQKYGFVGLDIDGKDFFCNYGHTDSMHLWTINDAKDGDVLASKDGDDILIFRNIDTSVSFSSYYNIVRKGESNWDNTRFFPATKEQHDLLFAKMKDSGYEWDANKKELKKIEHTLNADKVIEWMDEHVPTKFEDMQNYVKQFKQDFGL